MKLLTVAIPSYNSEKYLSKCMNSLCCEQFIDMLDIVVVNDGSTDGTSALAHSYRERFPASVSVIDKENAGHGSGINTAILSAKGKYFQVIDSDDWVESHNMPALLSQLEKSFSDIVICHFDMVDMSTGVKQHFLTEEIPLGKEYSIEEFMSYPRPARNCCFFHGVIYRTDFYRDAGIKLSERIFYEDQEYASIPFYYAKSILPLDLVIYQYMVGNVSQSISNSNQVKNMWQIERVFWNICDFYLQHGEMADGKKQYFLFKLSTLLLSYYVAGLLKNPDRKQGRASAKRVKACVLQRCPELYNYSKKKYAIAYLLHCLHISADMLERAKRTKLYYRIRKHL